MDEIIIWVSTQLKTNPFFTAVLGGGAIGTLYYTVVSWSKRIFNFIIPLFFCTLRAQDQDENSYLIREWMANRFKNSKYRKNFRLSYHDEMVLPGNGIHYFIFKNRLCFIEVIIENLTFSTSRQEKVSYSINILGIDNSIIKEFLSVIKQEFNERIRLYNPNVLIYSHTGEYICKKRKRSLSSIYGNRSKINNIINRLDFFINNEQWYKDRSIPYKFNILLYGSPGCGKSSLILAIASYLDKHITKLDISKSISIGIENTLITIEDIDAQFMNAVTKRDIVKTNKYCNKVTSDTNANNKSTLISNDPGFGPSLSDVLNLLDGLDTTDGAITIISTNDISSLDEAFLRPGRMDLLIELEPLKRDDIIEMALAFGVNINKSELVEDIHLSAAKVQHILNVTPFVDTHDCELREKLIYELNVS